MAGEESLGAARLDIEVDVTQLEAAIKTAKSRLADMSTDAQKQYQQLGAAEKRRVDSLITQADTIALTKGQQLAYNAALKTSGPVLDEITRKIAQNEAKIRSGGAQLNAYGLSAKQTTQALRQVPAQLTDIVTGLASGQRPLMVLLQQGGQLKDVFGGIVPAAQALGGALLKLVNPYTLTAGAVASLLYLESRAEKQELEYQKAIILTGNAAGTTADQLQTYAARIGQQLGSQSKAAEVLVQLVQTGVVSSKQLEASARTAIALEKAAGIAAAETVKNLTALGRDPVGASKELNTQYHYLTASIYEQIIALRSQGRTAEAAALAQRAYLTEIDDRARQVTSHLGTLQELARDTGFAFSRMWDKFIQLGAPDTLQQQIDEMDAKIAELRQARGRWLTNDSILDSQIDYYQHQRDGLQVILDGEKSTAEYLRKQQQENDKLVNDTNIRYAQGIKDRAALEKYFSDRRAAQADAELAALRRSLNSQQSTISHAQELLDARRSAGLVSDKEYYEARRELIARGADVQVAALRQENAALDRESRRLKEEAAKARELANSLFGSGSDQYQERLAEASRKEEAARVAQLRNDEQKRANLAEIAQVTADQAGKTEVLRVTEEGRLNKLQIGYNLAADSANKYLATLAEQYRLEERNQFSGSKQKEFDSTVSAIREKYAQQRQQIERDRANNPTVDRAVYDHQLALVDYTLEQELSLYRQHWAALREGEMDWRNGAEQAVAEYLEASRNAAELSATLFTDAFQGAEDAVVEFVRTSKVSFHDMANSIIADLARIAYKQAITGIFGAGRRGSAPLMTGGTDLPAGGFPVTQAAKGGVFSSPSLSAYSSRVVNKPTMFAFASGAGLMGEAGPEAIMPLKRTQGGKLGVVATGAKGMQVQINNYAGVQTSARQERARTPDGSELERLVIDIIAKDAANGGRVASALRNRFDVQDRM
jgi:lambda family phage tail tape measure protein